MPKRGKKLVVIIPCFNEEKTIGEVVRKAKRFVQDVLVIDDSSQDNSAQEARQAGAEVITHILNQGVGISLRTGYNTAFSRGYDYIIQLDGDGQHDPKYIPQLIDHLLKKKCDLVIGSRFLNSSHKRFSFIRKWGIKFFSTMTNFLGGVKVTDVTSGFRAYRAKSLKKLSEITYKNWAIEQTIEAGFKGLKVAEYSVEMPTRKIGQSQFDFQTIFNYPFKMFEASLRVILFRR